MPEFQHSATISDIACDMTRTAQRQGACSDFSYLYRSNLQHRHAPHREFHLVTDEITANLPPLPDAGLVHLFIKHTSTRSFDQRKRRSRRPHGPLSHLRPAGPRARILLRPHAPEGDDDMPAHAKSTLTGVELTLPVTQAGSTSAYGKGIYLCEFATALRAALSSPP